MKGDSGEEIPLLSGNLANDAVLNPRDFVDYLNKRHRRSPSELPPYCILAFFHELYDHVEEAYDPRLVHIGSEGNPMIGPIQVFRYKDIDVAHVFPRIGAPNAGAMLEMMIAMGGVYFVFIGGVGVLSAEIRRGEILVPDRALRDEGMSFHYQEPSRYSHPSALVLGSTKKALQEKGVQFREGGTWTTDAYFRETHEKVRAFRDEGCLSVEMEASALFSIAAFRKKHIGGLFKAGDCVAGEEWDSRREEGDVAREEGESRKLLGHALDVLHLLHEEGESQ
jgi:uridine phosphorylase